MEILWRWDLNSLQQMSEDFWWRYSDKVNIKMREEERQLQQQKIVANNLEIKLREECLLGRKIEREAEGELTIGEEIKDLIFPQKN